MCTLGAIVITFYLNMPISNVSFQQKLNCFSDSEIIAKIHQQY